MPGHMIFGFKYFSVAGQTTQGALNAAHSRDPHADPAYTPPKRETKYVFVFELFKF